MVDISVIKIPQWQGSSRSPAHARDLATGAALLADTVPAIRRRTVPVPENPGVPAAPGPGEVRGLDVLTEIADGARRAVAERAGDLIVTVGGDCGVELAPVSAAAERYGDGLAVVWFDAHGDLNTPGSSPSHAFHGMILRTLLGDGPQALLPARPLRPDQAVLAGVRALDPAEQSYATATGLRRLSPRTLTAQPPNDATNAVVAAVGETGAEAVYIHVDLDVLDPGTFGSQSCPEPGGITPETLEAAVRALTARFELAGLGITEYRPLRERDQDTLRTLVPRLLDGLG